MDIVLNNIILNNMITIKCFDVVSDYKKFTENIIENSVLYKINLDVQNRCDKLIVKFPPSCDIHIGFYSDIKIKEIYRISNNKKYKINFQRKKYNIFEEFNSYKYFEDNSYLNSINKEILNIYHIDLFCGIYFMDIEYEIIFDTYENQVFNNSNYFNFICGNVYDKYAEEFSFIRNQQYIDEYINSLKP